MLSRLASRLRSGVGCAIFVFLIVVDTFSGRLHAEEGVSLKGYRVWTGDFDGMQERRLIRILVPFSKTIYLIDRGKQLDTAVEAGDAQAAELNEGRNKLSKAPLQ